MPTNKCECGFHPWLTLLLALTVCTTAVAAQPAKTTVNDDMKTAVLALENELCTALNTKNSLALRGVLAAQFELFLPNEEIVSDLDDAAEDLRSSSACMPQDSEVQVSGDAAWVSGLSERKTKSVIEELQLLDFLVRRNGHWRIAARSSLRLDPQAYLDHALDLLENNFYRASSVDWRSVRREAHKKAAGVQTTIGTYPALRFVLAQTHDDHSGLRLSDTLRKREAALSGAGADSTAAEAPKQTHRVRSPFLKRSVPEGNLLSAANKNFALVVVPFCAPENAQDYVVYTKQLLKVMEGLISSHPDGWIVDLRGNMGGNMWPMIVGLGSLIGNNDQLGEFVSRDERSIWFYEDGRGGVRTSNADTVYLKVSPESTDGVSGNLEPHVSVKEEAPSWLGSIPVAVLIDGGTASSGEAVAIALEGRPLTRFFGEHTWGVSTAVNEYKLIDGAVLHFAVAVDADRTGKQYNGGIDPDEVINPGPSPSADANDPVVAAAIKWLMGRPNH